MKFKRMMSLNRQMTTLSKNLIFPEFEDIKVSTKTFIAMTNLNINLQKLFDFLPTTNYVVIPKKRGRKKKFEYIDPNIGVESGSILTMKFENNMKGVDLKQKKMQSKKKPAKWFRNSFTIVILIDGKPINFKICQNGMFQITGIKVDSQAEECIKYIWSYIKEQHDIYSFSRSNNLEVLFIPAMRNIDFSVGFNIDREKLTNYMNTQTDFHSLLETSFGYTGVNIKFPIVNDITTMGIKKIIYLDENNWSETMTTYKEYISFLTEKERLKKINKDRYTTFLVFHSGKIIVSSSCAEFARGSYYDFLDIIRKSYHIIEEKLDVI
jgi:TATA-box binding protein (TBP) (component of TFIID and TFIIIB)